MKKLILALGVFSGLAANPVHAEVPPIRVGSVSQNIDVFFRDTSITTRKEGKTGYAVGGSIPTCSYQRSDQASATAITFVAQTDGTWTSSGFVQRDSSALPGVYQIGLPNAALLSGTYVTLSCIEGTAIDRLALEIPLIPLVTASDYQVPVTTCEGTGCTACASENSAYIGLGSSEVTTQSAYETGFAVVLMDPARKVYASTCIKAYEDGCDAVETAQDVSSKHAPGDGYAVVPQPMCRVRTELGTLPGTASYSMQDALSYVYQWLRFKRTETATQQQLYKDDGSTVLESKTVGDNGTLLTVGEGS